MIGIIMGSDSDLPVMAEGARLLDEMGVNYEMTIISAHRTPDRLYSYAEDAETRGIKVIIAGAGGSAHLPGMVASICSLPVIGVPIKTASLSGVDSLYSIVQMPPGIPVATVAINGGLNAALLAVQILGCHDDTYRRLIKQYKSDLQSKVTAKAAELEAIGHTKYLKNFDR